MEIGREQLLQMYERMQAIRGFELTVREKFAKGEIPGFVHLYAGEEAVGVGVCANLTDQDFITSTHRGHGHCIAKGCDLKGMMAEVYGKATGLCKGKGGSMHIADVTKGMLGANGIVGGGFAMAAGAGLTAKVKGTQSVTVCFFGDGASNQGAFHEAVNLAAIWKLPVIFVCENNQYAETTPVWYSTAAKTIADRAQGYNIPGVVVDGQDLFAVYEAAGTAIVRARSGFGPTLLECKTYRHYGHFEGDTQTYKVKKDLDLFMGDRDPLAVFKATVLERGLLKADDLKQVEEKVQAEIAAALKFAQESPQPALADLQTDVLAPSL
jgi:acetoin:2,6-dichlorophenolindophenol oxidoreductase subunit alpha